VNGLSLVEALMLKPALEEYIEKHSGAPADRVSVKAAMAMHEGVSAFIMSFTTDEGLLQLWTDGAARPTNPGPAGIGVVGKMGGRTVLEIAEYIGKTTNNVAEYQAVVAALRRAVDMGVTRVLLRSDSKLVVNQVNQRWQCRDESLIPLLGRVRGLAQRFETFAIEWIPRELNREADGLSVAGAYSPKACGMCTHEWHFTSMCTAPGEIEGEACGCPYSFKGGLTA
jgi:ribonuclease HI